MRCVSRTGRSSHMLLSTLGRARGQWIGPQRAAGQSRCQHHLVLLRHANPARLKPHDLGGALNDHRRTSSLRRLRRRGFTSFAPPPPEHPCLPPYTPSPSPPPAPPPRLSP